MPTQYTKTNDIVTTNTKINDISTSYSGIADITTQYSSFGGLIRLVTEGLRKLIMTEGNTDHIVVSHGEDKDIYTDIADISTAYTKINDI